MAEYGGRVLESDSGVTKYGRVWRKGAGK